MTELIKTLDVHDRSKIIEGAMVISSSLRNRRRRRGPPPPPCSFHVGGPITPNVKGCYVFIGYYNDRASYKHNTLDWFIWYDPLSEPILYNWWITNTLGNTGGPGWLKFTVGYESETGDYAPAGGAAGTAKVELPPT